MVPLRVPPLRERREDIAPLVDAFVRAYGDRYSMGPVEVEPALLEALTSSDWPGNVRELENTIARLLALAPDDRITLASWRSLASPSRRPVSAPAPSADPGPSLPLRARIEAVESSIIADAYQQCGRNQSETARRLGISRPALIEKLHKYGLMERSPL